MCGFPESIVLRPTKYGVYAVDSCMARITLLHSVRVLKLARCPPYLSRQAMLASSHETLRLGLT